MTANQSRQELQAREMDADIVIEGGTAITMVDGQEPLPDTSIFITDGKITDIRKTDYQGNQVLDSRVEIIDAKEAIIMPGLINAHTHGAMTLFRGFADDLPLKQWLFDKIFPAEARFLNPDTVYWGSLLGCLEMIASGTTCCVDGYFFQGDTVRAVHESGLRGLIAQGVIDFPAPGITDPKENIRVAREFIERWLGYSDLITPGIFCHSPLTCSDRTLKAAKKISQSFDLPLQIHLSETREEVDEVMNKTGKRPVHYLDELGLVDETLIASHAVHLDDNEMECLRKNSVKVVHVPESNMKLCSGAGRISDMVKMGLTVGLGTDGCSSNNNMDLFCEMDTAAKLSKVFDNDPTSLDARTVLKMATIWGAAVLGLENEIGTLEKGKKADIIVLDLHNPHLCPVYDPVSVIVYSANGSDVKDVVVNGKVLMKNRKFTTLNSNEIMEKVNNISKNIKL
ncbi:MAG: amidohydrolase [Deltaproteobacteria bacterium]|nr:amidohydrolase [Deltaproteobacteria bacterium]MBW1909901.1 amidohydrolase [Deltaproteobacteria bacterium]MBW2115071.1 amidohydrolase [Deltaproteobacteria bacterium]